MGILRLLLALSVISSHTVGFAFGIGGRPAVILFYIISGFYMCLILNTKYTGLDSNITFYKSRFLRLWVPYAVVLFFIVCFSLHAGALQSYFTSVMQHVSIFTSLFFILSTIFIVGQEFFFMLTISPDYKLNFNPKQGDNGFYQLDAPLFSVSLEMYFYLMAPFILRSRNKVFIFTLIGLIYQIFITYKGIDSLKFRYYLFPCTIAYFGTGASLYHIWFNGSKNLRKFLMLFIIVISMSYINSIVDSKTLILFILILPLIFYITKTNRIDRFIGELSYGAYIIHYPLIILLKDYFKAIGLNQFLGVTIATLSFSLILRLVVEIPLDRFRQKLLYSNAN